MIVHVRQSGSHNNTQDGLSYETAFLGLHNIKLSQDTTDTVVIHGEVDSVNAGINALNKKVIFQPADSRCAINNIESYLSLSGGFEFVGVDIYGADNYSCIYCQMIDSFDFSLSNLIGGKHAISFSGDNTHHHNIKIDQALIAGQSAESIRMLATKPGTSVLMDGFEVINSDFRDTGGIELRTEADTGDCHINNFSLTGSEFNRISGIACRVTNGKAGAGERWSKAHIIGNRFNDTGSALKQGGGVSIEGFGGNYGDTLINDNEFNRMYGQIGAMDLFYTDNLIVNKNYIDTVNTMPDGIDGNGILFDWGNKGAIASSNMISNCPGRPLSDAGHNSGAGLMVLDGSEVLSTDNHIDSCKHGLWDGAGEVYLRSINDMIVNCVTEHTVLT